VSRHLSLPRAANATLVWLLALAGIGIPVAVLVRGAPKRGPVHSAAALGQRDTAIPRIAPTDLIAFQRWASTTQPALVALCYHDIVDAHAHIADRFTVSAPDFAAQMAVLHAAGFSTITAAQLSGYLTHGDPLPPRPILITFDDGTQGIWTYADRVLEHFDFHAMSMVITGRVEVHPHHYLSWDEIEQLRRSGRWDFESHTANGHAFVAVDTRGANGAFLINRAWLAVPGRLETPTEALTRVTDDLTRSKRDLAAHGLGTPEFFAYPFSSLAGPTDDSVFARQARDAVRRNFLAAFVNLLPARAVDHRDYADTGLIPRIEVHSGQSARSLLDTIVAAQPLPVVTDPLEDPTLWRTKTGQPLRGSTTFSDGTLAMTSAQQESNAYLLPWRAADWTDYVEEVTVHGLARDPGGTAELGVLLGSPDARGDYAATTTAPFRVGVSSHWLSVSDDLTGSGAFPGSQIRVADSHLVSIRVTGGRVSVSVDGVTLFDHVMRSSAAGVAGGGISIGVRHAPSPLTFTDLSLGSARGS
jgi:biofilm PGA synthesis lipoprotein PgaB